MKGAGGKIESTADREGRETPSEGVAEERNGCQTIIDNGGLTGEARERKRTETRVKTRRTQKCARCFNRNEL